MKERSKEFQITKEQLKSLKNQLDKLQYNYLGDDVDNVTGKDYDTFYEDLELNTGGKN